MSYCANCGQELKAGAKFCGSCGSAVEAVQPVEPDVIKPPADAAPVVTEPQPPAPQPPIPAPAGYQQPVYSQQTAVQTKKPFNKNILIFGGIGILVVVLVLVLAFVFFGGKGKSDPYLGMWIGTTVEIDGEEFQIEDFFGGNGTIELKSGGKCILNFSEDITDGTWKKTKTGIVIKAEGETIEAVIDKDKMTLENYMDTGLSLIFIKEGSSTEESNSGKSGNLVKPTGKTEKPTEPTVTESETEPIETEPEALDAQAVWNGSWFGYLWITDAYGEWENVHDLFDAMMVIDVDEDGEGTMQIFLEDDETQTIDTYITATETYFQVTDGIFWDYGLDSNIWWHALAGNDDKLLVIADSYVDPELEDGDGFDYIIYLRPFGVLWTEEEQSNDILPYRYADYVAAVESGVTDAHAWRIGESSGSGGGDANSGGGSTDFNPDPSNYGADGWVYTEHLATRMRIPEGWENSRALNGKFISVRSAASGGDTISISIEPYSDKTPADERNPESQVKKNASDAEVFSSTWGNVGVYYREDSFKDYNQVAGFAVFDDQNYLYFDIRVQIANHSTLADFMKTDAWATMIDTFVLDPP